MTAFTHSESGELPLARDTVLSRLVADASTATPQSWELLPNGAGVVIHGDRPPRRPGGLATVSQTRITVEPAGEGVIVRMSVAMTFTGRNAWAVHFIKPFARRRLRRAHRALLQSLESGDVAPLERERSRNLRTAFRARRAVLAVYAVITLPLLALVAFLSWWLALALALFLVAAIIFTLTRISRAQRRSMPRNQG